ncbi:TPA: exlusion protein FxsA, partial [Vibrio cholerae]|nr:exlusion protein FxsA [Vibrio cholerae]EGQ9225825.1 exlusion protein FxsA [Vibrio cholerae]EGR0417039.1 exlusion protein FxsA [Vibrio cholerae]EGR0424474.1 exlusion protein FxsA [Vibrio cholerae]EGR0465042.1 exlusion protein FxsA [Vibrio cholerae]
VVMRCQPLRRALSYFSYCKSIDI